METLVYFVKYGFLIVFVVEAVLVGRALITLALEKARTPAPEAPAAQE